MFAFATLVAFASTALPQALAHGGILSYSNAGNWYKGGTHTTAPLDRLLSSVLGLPTIPSNTPPTPPWLATTTVAQVLSAGSDITAYWNQNLSHDTSPMLTYLAKCPGNPSSCDDVSSNTLKWFKIDEAGLLSGTVASALYRLAITLSVSRRSLSTPCPLYNFIRSAPRLRSLVVETAPPPRTNSSPSLVATSRATRVSPSTCTVKPRRLRPPTSSLSMGKALAPAPHPTHIPAASAPEKTSAPMTSAPRPTTTTVVNQFAQCGGIDFTGPTTCASGFT